MKRLGDCKKLFNFLVWGALWLSVPIFFSLAQTAEELNVKIWQKNSDIAKLEREITQYQDQLDSLAKQKNSLNTSIKQLDLTRKKLLTSIAVTQNKIDETSYKIKILSSQITSKEKAISNDHEAIAKQIRQTDELEQRNILTNILSQDDFAYVWNDLDNLIAVREKIRQKVVELKQVKGELEDTRQETVDAKNELLALKSQLADQKKIVEQNTQEKKKLLTQTKNNEANYQKLLKDRLAKKEAFEKELLEYESQLKFILDPSTLPGKHVLSWPLDYIYITQFFGVTKDSKLYTSGSHNGVDFRASVGTPVKAAADGTIYGVGDTDKVCNGASFGKFVFIKYNNGLASTYGHLSLIKVREGEEVKRGEVVGYSGNTGYSTGPHLHVSIYAAQAVNMESRASKTCEGHTYYLPIAPINAYLDPMIYFPIYKN
jgi:murein DD-endopeptidase MepM/ murein hydrolase activator NlpD